MVKLKSVEFGGYISLGKEQVSRLPSTKLPGATAVLLEDIGTVVVRDGDVVMAWVPWSRCTAVPEEENGSGKPSAPTPGTRKAK